MREKKPATGESEKNPFFEPMGPSEVNYFHGIRRASMARWLGLLLATGLATPALRAQELTDESFDKLQAYIVPSKKDLLWREIPWRPVFWDAVVEAQQKDMPVLLWGMNGHPMACT
jgi:hypothetical protein